MELLDLIKTNLKELPNESCIRLDDETNSSGQVLMNFRYFLEAKEMGIFDTLTIRVFPDNQKNYDFSTLDKPMTILGRIKLLVADLYKIYGEDSSMNGPFNDYDESSLSEGDYWSGRSFTDHKVHHPVTMLGYDSDEGLSLTIFSPFKI